MLLLLPRPSKRKRDSDTLSDGPSFREISGVGLKGVEGGWVKGEVVYIDGPVSFLGDVDPERGTLERGGHLLDLNGRIMVFTEGAGSTVGSYVIYNMRLNGVAPRGMIMCKADAIITIGCIVASIPLVHRIALEDLGKIGLSGWAEINSSLGLVRVAPGKENR